MNKIQKFLLAFDFLQTTKPAIQRAASLAQSFSAELVPVHAVEHIPYNYGLNYWHVIHNKIKPRIDAICESLREKGIRVHPPVIKEGRPADVILSVADDMDVNMIVLGLGKASLVDRIVGTTAAKVIRSANHPVCIVPRKDKAGKIRRILCAVDFSVASNNVMATAIPMARSLNAALWIYHVVPKSKQYPGLSRADIPVIDLETNTQSLQQSEDVQQLNKELQAKFRRLFDDYLGKFDLSGVRYKKILGVGAPEKKIVAACKKKNINLLIMGTIGQNPMARLLAGNTTEKVLQTVPCSLITVRHRDIFHTVSQLQERPEDDVASRLTSPATEEWAAYIEQRFENGKQLLAAGQPEKAIAEFQLCIDRDEHFHAAYDAAADAWEKLGNVETANKLRSQARQQRRYVWDMQRQGAKH